MAKNNRLYVIPPIVIVNALMTILWVLPAAAAPAKSINVASSTATHKISPTSKRIVAVSTVTATTKIQPLHVTYKYQADRYRDPFIPLIGAESKSDNNDHTPQIAALALKGIIQDTKGRMAVLTSGASSFILRGGRLYDAHNKAVKGISGVVKSNSVMLIGSDRTVKELHIVRPKGP